MKHLDLFSGIGGFSLAVDRVWHEQKNQHIFVEQDDFCTEVLKKHWPEAEYHKDIREFVADAKRQRPYPKEDEQELEGEGSSELRIEQPRPDERPFILTGGFPCQPFSQAGRRKGTDDDNGNGDALPCGERCDIIGVCNGDTTTSVRDAGNSRGERKEVDTANPVRQNTKQSGEQRTPTKGGELKTSGRENASTRFTNDMEGNALVAERATSHSSQSTTRTGEGTRSDEDTTARRGNSSSRTDTPRPTNSSATTATTPSTTSEPVLINNEPVFLLTGGFPCQPFSQAGRRKGTSDDRYLWPEMYECIKLFQPEWVIAENVAGLATWNEGLVFETVCADLEKEGYEVQPFRIPAVAVGAPHRRDRWWFVAYRPSWGRHGWGRANSKTNSSGLESDKGRWDSQGSKSAGYNTRTEWESNWPEVATRLCRVDDGVPRRLDRNPRLKALGNAIVPQVAEEIMKAIKSATPPPTE